MKTNALYLLASAVCLSVAFASCADDVQQFGIDPSQPLKQIVMTTQDFQPESGSRTVYQIADGAVACTWAANDTVGVFPEKGAQAYFPMASGAGTKNAAFDGEGWALKDGYTYASYYPYIGNAYLDRNAVPVSYAGQTQQGNASMDHLGDYDYMAAAPTAPEFGSAQFTFKHLSALVQLKISVPQPATLTSVKLVTDAKAFAVEGQVDIMADAPVLTPVTSSTEVVLNLQDVATTAANQVVTLYMMLPPADLSGQTLKAVVVSDKGTQDVALETKNFKAGTAYALSGEMESSAPGYKDGVVTVAQAGTMKEFLGDNWLNITSLKVVGPINGDDVRCLRQMLGGKIHYNVNVEKGKLTSLDLSDASIVGGGSYYYYVSSSYYYTSNDVVSDYMFYQCPNLEDIVLPVDVTSIGYLVFGTCSSLTSIVIPDGVITFGNYTFSGCSSLTSIDIPDGLTAFGKNAFSGCTSLITIDIPDGVTEISPSAFYGCSSLTSIDIPDGVTAIGESAFYNCSSLLSIDIPDVVTVISDHTFSGCSSLTAIDIPNGVTAIGHSVFENCTSLISIEIPDGITKIGYWTFSGCSSLTSINIPDSVTEIEDYAFSGCSSLASIDIPDGVTEINRSLFEDCYSLVSIVIPDGVVSIGEEVFYDCASLVSIDIPSSVTSISSGAFAYCSLESVHITDLSAWCNITFQSYNSNPLRLGAILYLNGEELTELVIPSDINRIKDYAFYGYRNMTKLTMGEQVISVGIQSFRDCSSLTQVYCQGTTPPTINPSSTNSSFNGASDKRTLFVPKGCSSAYQSSDWASFFGAIQERE